MDNENWHGGMNVLILFNSYRSQVVATAWAFWLPPVLYGIYFHRKSSSTSILQRDQGSPTHKPLPPVKKQAKAASALIVRHARSAYARSAVLAWSGLYAASLALFVHAQTYVQVLWQDIQRDDEEPAVQTLVGAGGAFAAASWSRTPLPAAAAAVQATAVFLGSYLPNIYVSYVAYIVMGSLFHFTITLASAKIAAQLSDESCFGLIFGINTFIGTVMQSLLTLILNQTLKLSTASVYFVLSGCYLFLSLFWLLGWIFVLYNQKRKVNMNN
ncbi:hypothetical protein MSG28_000584 [Choristoneura fumiferana]|uniref:Uncharacterized protein n=1 Tax=Choristoneura fumiferana TaxID=7141 RepID=A0ACC0K1U0_CHOFU|nr:hypothetical protein MSG28_000584 [Choristoneura fumiferana]